MLRFLDNSTEDKVLDDTTRAMYDYISQVKIQSEVRDSYMTLGEMMDLREDEFREEGADMRLITMIHKKIHKGKSLEEIADDLEEEPEDIKTLYDVVSEFASDSDFDVDKVYEEYTKQKMVLQ